MKSDKKLDLLVIGIDGATFNVLLPLLKRNKLKTLKKIIDSGVYGELESTVPPISGPAWASFMTGKNPGKHGLFGFIDYDPQRYDGFLRGEIVTSSSFAGSTFFDFLGLEETGSHRIGVITVPITYPPWMINGVMIPGYPCPGSQRIYCSPEDTQIQIKETLLHGRERHASERQEVSNAFDVMKRRTRTAVELVKKMNLDCLVIVFGATDRMQHFYGVKDEVTAKCYQIADSQIAKLLELTSRDTKIFIMSDHGADPHPQIIFNTNHWLNDLGLLILNDKKAKAFSVFRNLHYRYVKVLRRFERLLLVSNRLKEAVSKSSGIYIGGINWNETKAFRYPMPVTRAEGIVINVKGRQEKGIVMRDEEYEELREKIIARLKNLRDPHNGNHIVRTCQRKEELYNGSYIERAPDIVFQLNEPYVPGDGLSETFARVSSSTSEDLKIVHSMRGILVASGSIIKSRGRIKSANIIDLAPTILYSMGVPIPENMDGHILFDIFEDKFKLGTTPKYVEEAATKREQGQKLTEKEKEEIKERLQGLGYL